MISMKLSEAADCLQVGFTGKDIEFNGCSTNSRKLNDGKLFIALKGERFDGHDFIEEAYRNGASAALVEKEKTTNLPIILVDDTRQAMGQLARYWRDKFDIPLIAITGSNGKTTVKEMLTSILQFEAPVLSTKGNLNNDIGVPLTLFGLGNEHRYAVIEMGANHPGEISWLSQISRPTVAVITQCAPAHLEGFGSVNGVAKAKAEIFEGLDESGIAVINADDEYADLWRNRVMGLRQFSFGLEKSADIKAESLDESLLSGKTDFVLTSTAGRVDISLPLLGKHNVLNALAAAACALCLGIDYEIIKRGLEAVTAVEGRLQLKTGINNSRIIDDTYNANPASFSVAINVLSGFQGERCLVLGDMGELGTEAKEFHSDIGKAAKTSGIERLYAIGKLSHASVKAFGDGAEHFETVQELVSTLREKTDSNVTLLVKGSRAMQMEQVVKALEECI